MEQAALWVSLVAALAAVAGSVFTYVQAKSATDSRRDAREAEAGAIAARDAAVAAQQESASASVRIAGVLEEQAAAQRAAASARPSPWSLEPGRYTKTGTAMLLRHVGKHSVSDVSLTFERAPQFMHLDPDPVPSEMRPGDAIELYYMRLGGDSMTTVVEVHWRWSDGEEMTTTRGTLS